MSFRFAPTLIVALVACSAAQAQQPTFPPGSGVGLVPPAGLAPSKSFSGFESVAQGASILTVDLPLVAFAEILVGFTPEGLAASGLQASGPSVDWKVAGGDGRLIRGKQTARGTVYRKWVVLAKSKASAAIVTVQAPETSSAALPDAAIEASLRTIALRDPPGLDQQVAALPFRLGDRAGFRLVRAITGSGVVLTEGPQDTLNTAAQPVLVIATGLNSGMPAAAARAGVAREGFNTVSGVDDVIVDDEANYEAGGASWSRIQGRGTYRASGEALYVAQWMRFAPGGYLRVVAISRLNEKERFADRFRRVAEAVSPK